MIAEDDAEDKNTTANTTKIKLGPIHYVLLTGSTGSFLTLAILASLKPYPQYVINTLLVITFLCFFTQSQSKIIMLVRGMLGDWLDDVWHEIYKKIFYKPAGRAAVINFFSEGRIDPYISCKLLQRRVKQNKSCVENFCKIGPGRMCVSADDLYFKSKKKIRVGSPRGLNPREMLLYLPMNSQLQGLKQRQQFNCIYANLISWSFEKCEFGITHQSVRNFEINGSIQGYLVIPRHFIFPCFFTVCVDIFKKGDVLHLYYTDYSNQREYKVRKMALTYEKVNLIPSIQQILCFSPTLPPNRPDNDGKNFFNNIFKKGRNVN